MRLNFNTIIYPIFGCVLGLNYYNTKMEHVILESQIDNEVEHCFEIHLFFIGISFVWYTNEG
ncbi:MAG: hypothetical protein Unbinned5434contig1000_11 [Prokaryotic dsDNA virus sp.]|jgi:hypothetical protein|nr:MAG: hypothetical protein Unbinned5434contig1000_11 [Prokaryotic dsDNA virus sp.]